MRAVRARGVKERKKERKGGNVIKWDWGMGPEGLPLDAIPKYRKQRRKKTGPTKLRPCLGLISAQSSVL